MAATALAAITALMAATLAVITALMAAILAAITAPMPLAATLAAITALMAGTLVAITAPTPPVATLAAITAATPTMRLRQPQLRDRTADADSAPLRLVKRVAFARTRPLGTGDEAAL